MKRATKADDKPPKGDKHERIEARSSTWRRRGSRQTRYADQLIASAALLIVVLMLSLSATLPRAGHRVLAILAVAVV